MLKPLHSYTWEGGGRGGCPVEVATHQKMAAAAAQEHRSTSYVRDTRIADVCDTHMLDVCETRTLDMSDKRIRAAQLPVDTHTSESHSATHAATYAAAHTATHTATPTAAHISETHACASQVHPIARQPANSTIPATTTATAPAPHEIIVCTSPSSTNCSPSSMRPSNTSTDSTTNGNTKGVCAARILAICSRIDR